MVIWLPTVLFQRACQQNGLWLLEQMDQRESASEPQRAKFEIPKLIQISESMIKIFNDIVI